MCTVFYMPLRTEVCFVFLSRKYFASKRVVKVFFVAPMKVKRRVSHLMFQNFWQKCYEIIRGKTARSISEMKGARTHTPPMNDAWTPHLTSIATFHSFQPAFARPLLSIETSSLCCVMLLFQVFLHTITFRIVWNPSQKVFAAPTSSSRAQKFIHFFCEDLNYIWHFVQVLLFALNWLFLFTSMWRV